MQRYIVGFFAMTAFVLLPLGVSAQNKGGTNGKTIQATAQDYATLARLTQVDGKIVSGDAEKITISIDGAARVVQPNNGGTGNTNPGVGGIGGKRGIGGIGGGVQIQRDHIEFLLPIKEKALIRKMYLSGGGFDEKGNVKGTGPDAKKPAAAPGGGYIADMSEFSPGTVVRLQLEAPKKTAAKKDDEEADPISRPIVKSVTALTAPKTAAMGADGANPKKKN